MKYVRMTIFALLLVCILALSFKISGYESALDEKDKRIETLRKGYVEVELANKEKEEYITDLHTSVESLTTNITVLEEKLNKLTTITGKLE